MNSQIENSSLVDSVLASNATPVGQQKIQSSSPLLRSGPEVQITDERCWKSIKNIAEILEKLRVHSLFLVTDGMAYESSGAKAVLEPILEKYSVSIFSDFEPNPKLQHMLAGLDLFRKSQAEVVVAIGGGTAIDLAKMIAACSRETSDPLSVILKQASFAADSVPLIAIPTTSGTGSEATQFAVIYVDGIKHSVDHAQLLPAFCFLDPTLTMSLPASITAHTGLDAFSQCMESMWSVRSNASSISDASNGLQLALEHLHSAVHSPSIHSRTGMLNAAHLSGRAINQTRTTASHAISYALTSDYGIPHGLAVAVTLGPMLVHNSKVTPTDVNDPRGAEHVRSTIRRILELLDCSDAEEGNQKICQFVQSLGCETRLSRLGIKGDQAIHSIVSKVNTERLQNNPRMLSSDQLFELLQSIH